MPRLPIQVLLTALLTVAGASSPLAQADEKPFARVNVDGPSAFLDGVQQPKDAREVPARDGSMLRTGKATGAQIRLSEGWFVLDENSSQLITYSFFKGARCLAVRLLTGQMQIHDRDVCFLTNVGPVRAYSNSRINVRVGMDGTVVTVIEGSANVDVPAEVTIDAHRQLLVHPDGTFVTRELTPDEAERSDDWTKRYDFSTQAPGHPSHAGAAAAAVVGAGVLACVFGLICDDDHDDHTWCCTPSHDNQVERIKEKQCRNQGGSGHGSEDEARAACTVAPPSPAAPDGPPVCCIYKEPVRIVPATKEECRANGGRLADPHQWQLSDGECSQVVE